MPENKFDSGHPHVVLPILHGESGDIHSVAVPEDESLSSFHSALGDAGYFHTALQTTEPSESGAMENTEKFKNAVRDAIDKSGDLHGPREAAFTVSNKSEVSPTQKGKQIFDEDQVAATNLEEPYGDQTFATVHTHPAPGVLGKNWIQRPSNADIKAAQTTHQNVYVVTQGGLWQVEPSGLVHQVFKNDSWLKQKKKTQ